MSNSLIHKYNMPGPRYTSYPTVPYWDQDRPASAAWETRALQTFLKTNNSKGIAIYVHLPFCESLCTYCGCNTRITKNHQVEEPYLLNILEEWSRYLDLFALTPRLSELHLGGGTPTFFSPENLKGMVEAILATVVLTKDAELSFEGHPANTSEAHLRVLYDLGFRRVSFGIQDFDPVVQKAIHRVQSPASVEKVTNLAREIGFTSVNFDLIYGLPFQTIERMKQTIAEVIRLKPDRIAFYSYAHVPWVKPGQRSYGEEDLPEGEDKRRLYEYGREQFEKCGYREIGMDHFALPADALFKAAARGKLNRNFMGYTSSGSELMVGLGVSAISDCGTAYIQNDKSLEGWATRLKEKGLPYFRGHLMTREDVVLRKHIHRLICKYETSWKDPRRQCEALFESIQRLEELEHDGLIEIDDNSLKVTDTGKSFIRNICMGFDAKLWRSIPQTQIFSKTV
jgi:oxygen-independent coproporphyrinogen III oxidase